MGVKISTFSRKLKCNKGRRGQPHKKANTKAHANITMTKHEQWLHLGWSPG